MVHDKIHCLTLDHEVLTKKGWKYYNNLNFNDEIATLNKYTHILEYNKPIDIIYFKNYNGKMYNIKNSNVDLNVTTNHRMLISKPSYQSLNESLNESFNESLNESFNESLNDLKCVWGDYDYELAGNIVGKYNKYKKDANWDIKNYQFILPSVEIDNLIIQPVELNMDSWLLFLGIWVADYKNEFNYNVNIDNITIYSKQLELYLTNYYSNINNNITKYLPDWVMNLSQQQSRILIESMMKNKTDKYDFLTNSTKLADQFQQLCLHAGWSSNISYCDELSYDLLMLNVIKNNNNIVVNHNNKVNARCIDNANNDFILQF